MKTIKASEFKAKCLKIMDEVSVTGEAVVITKNGKAVSKLVPYQEPRESLFGRHQREVEVIGDVVGPVGEDWDAEK